MKTSEEYEKEIAELKAGLEYREGQLEDCMEQISQSNQEPLPSVIKFQKVKSIEVNNIRQELPHLVAREIRIRTETDTYTLCFTSNWKGNLDVYKKVSTIERL